MLGKKSVEAINAHLNYILFGVVFHAKGCPFSSSFRVPAAVSLVLFLLFLVNDAVQCETHTCFSVFLFVWGAGLGYKFVCFDRTRSKETKRHLKIDCLIDLID